MGYLIFQLFSHANLYEDTGDHVFKSVGYHADKRKTFDRLQRKISRVNPFNGHKEKVEDANEMGSNEPAGEVEQEMASMNLWVAIASLVVITVVRPIEMWSLCPWISVYISNIPVCRRHRRMAC